MMVSQPFKVFILNDESIYFAYVFTWSNCSKLSYRYHCMVENLDCFKVSLSFSEEFIHSVFNPRSSLSLST